MTKKLIIEFTLLIVIAIFVYLWTITEPNSGAGFILGCYSIGLIAVIGGYVVYYYGKKINSWWEQLPNK